MEGPRWETHDGVCRIRSELGEAARVEDVGGEDIAEGWEGVDIGGGVRVGHICSGCSTGDGGRAGLLLLLHFDSRDRGRIYTRQLDNSTTTRFRSSSCFSICHAPRKRGNRSTNSRLNDCLFRLHLFHPFLFSAKTRQNPSQTNSPNK